jgi:hypothetical protein
MSSEDTIKALQQVQHASKQTNPKAVQFSSFNDPLSHQQTHPHLKLDRTIIEAAKTAAFHELEKVRDAAAATFRMHAHTSLRLPHSASFLTFPPLLFLLFHRRLRHLSPTQDMCAVHEVAAFARKLFAEGKKVPHFISATFTFIAISSFAFTSNAALCRLRQRARSRRRHAAPHTPARCAHLPYTQFFQRAAHTPLLMFSKLSSLPKTFPSAAASPRFACVFDASNNRRKR